MYVEKFSFVLFVFLWIDIITCLMTLVLESPDIRWWAITFLKILLILMRCYNKIHFNLRYPDHFNWTKKKIYKVINQKLKVNKCNKCSFTLLTKRGRKEIIGDSGWWRRGVNRIILWKIHLFYTIFSTILRFLVDWHSNCT